MKRMLVCMTVILAAILAFAAVNVHAVTDLDLPLTGYHLVYGDVTLDGKVTTGDVSFLMMYCVGAKYLNAMQTINSDVNCDAQVNTADAGLILKLIAGMIKELPYSPAKPGSSAEFSFYNSTFPKSGDRLPYGRSYALNGIISSQYPLTEVKIKIQDKTTGDIEIEERVTFDRYDNICHYNTQTSSNPIDNLIKFSSLSTGAKLMQVIGSNVTSSNVVVYECSFKIGFTFSEIADYCYDKGDHVSATEARKVLTLLNSLNFIADEGAKIVETGVGFLGKKYSELDCSGFVQKTVDNAIGVRLPRISVEQAVYCEEHGLNVNYDDKVPGDLVFMSNTGCHCGRYHEIHHSAIYLGNYDGIDYLIESTSSLNGVVMRRIWGISSGVWVIHNVARVRS